ncbi:hypothetical protein [Nonomuraea sp. NPDC049480]|uniref:hypothetical protein n=1 Tax=Nonomuraea sp. NPDC049480 TaxID=3364353 RepID=UPI0037B8E46B
MCTKLYTYDLGLMYGEHYGYRSSLNQSMVRHRYQKVAAITSVVELGPGDLVLDIGSDDSTLLRVPVGQSRTGGDRRDRYRIPRWYPLHVALISEFLTKDVFIRAYGSRR